MSNCSHPLSESAMFFQIDKKVQVALIHSFFYVLPRFSFYYNDFPSCNN